MAQHLRAIFSDAQWLSKHKHMKIHEMVVFYIDKDETDPNYPKFVWPAAEQPKYSTVTDISKKYCFLMRGGGRVGSRRFSCWCTACCDALFNAKGCADAVVKGKMTSLLDIPSCMRRHLNRYKHNLTDRFGFKEETITCTAARGLANAKQRAQALWKKLEPLVKAGAGKYIAIQARQLWSTEERVHLRPGHFWAAKLGDWNGEGSPIIHSFTARNEYFEFKPPRRCFSSDKEWQESPTEKYRGDPGESLLLLHCYYNRVASDPEGLTFMQWQKKKGSFA